MRTAKEIAQRRLSSPDEEGQTHVLGKEVRVFSRAYEARRIDVFSQLLDHLQKQECK